MIEAKLKRNNAGALDMYEPSFIPFMVTLKSKAFITIISNIQHYKVLAFSF